MTGSAATVLVAWRTPHSTCGGLTSHVSRERFLYETGSSGGRTLKWTFKRPQWNVVGKLTELQELDWVGPEGRGPRGPEEAR